MDAGAAACCKRLDNFQSGASFESARGCSRAGTSTLTRARR